MGKRGRKQRIWNEEITKGARSGVGNAGGKGGGGSVNKEWKRNGYNKQRKEPRMGEREGTTKGVRSMDSCRGESKENVGKDCIGGREAFEHKEMVQGISTN